MTPELLERRAHVMRAAIAEAGGDPDAVIVRDGQLHWRTGRITVDVAWRAWELSRHATGGPPRCRECFIACGKLADRADKTALLRRCTAPRMFVIDCGAVR